MMQPMPATPSQKLADLLLAPSTLDEYVATRRQTDPKMSWRLIARELYRDTNGDVDVTGESLRNWYPDADRQEVA